ncbi:MAG: aldehyde-activating protein [Alphaproteobacteria bacterium]|nr:aldehyde-activating protein [Alphaproteobacteria bacterium]
MPVPFTGGCACGEIRYSCAAEPLYMGNCHCRDCQQATGSAYFPAVLVKGEDFTLLSGEPQYFERPSDQGHPMRRAFCPSCGSPVFLINGARSDNRVLYAGSLDDPSWYTPSRDIFVRSAQPWDILHPDLPKNEAMPTR